MKITLIKIFILLMVCLVASVLFFWVGGGSSERVNNVEPASIDVKTYEKNALKIVHPSAWVLLHDEAGIIADRTVAFETPGISRVTLYFYKKSPKTEADLADNLVQQLDLEAGKNIQTFQRENVDFEGFKGLKLSWLSVGLSETRNEVIILQIRREPFPVYVQFHLFDDEINSQRSQIGSFIRGITFDPQGI
ncbi:MAG: hypothetical protein U5M23_13730 [Marinagarivorans sp.]|nr:hypothetical protein [Marinagarivorans sp.]